MRRREDRQDQFFYDFNFDEVVQRSSEVFQREQLGGIIGRRAHEKRGRTQWSE
jgi:hypothetical protein